MLAWTTPHTATTHTDYQEEPTVQTDEKRNKTRDMNDNGMAKPSVNTDEDGEWVNHDNYAPGLSCNRIVTRSQTAFNRIENNESDLKLVANADYYRPPNKPHLMITLKGLYGNFPRTVVTRSSGEKLPKTEALCDEIAEYVEVAKLDPKFESSSSGKAAQEQKKIEKVIAIAKTAKKGEKKSDHELGEVEQAEDDKSKKEDELKKDKSKESKKTDDKSEEGTNQIGNKTEQKSGKPKKETKEVDKGPQRGGIMSFLRPSPSKTKIPKE